MEKTQSSDSLADVLISNCVINLRPRQGRPVQSRLSVKSDFVVVQSLQKTSASENAALR
jgi:hypothetical protein